MTALPVPGGEGMALPFTAAICGISLVIIILLWYVKLRSKRYAKTTLIVGILIILCPLLEVVKYFPLWVQVTKEEHQTKSLYIKAKVNAIRETPIQVEDSVIGLHIDMDMSVPTTLVTEKDKHGQMLLGHLNYFCEKDMAGGTDSLLRASIIKRKKGNVVADFHLVALNISNHCEAQPDGMTHILFQNDFYPERVQYATPDGSKICTASDYPTQSDTFAHEMSGGSALEWDLINSLSVVRAHDAKDVSSDFPAQIGNHFDQLSDPSLWQRIYQSLKPDHLKEMGYQTCKVDYPGYNLHLSYGLGPTEYNCYCLVGKHKETIATANNLLDYRKEAQILEKFFPDRKVERTSLTDKNGQIIGTRLTVHTQYGDKIYDAPSGYDNPFMATNYHPGAQLLILKNYLNDNQKMVLVIDMQTGQEIKNIQELQEPLFFSPNSNSFAFINYAEECSKSQNECAASLFIMEKKTQQSLWKKYIIPYHFNPTQQQPFTLKWEDNTALAVKTCQTNGNCSTVYHRTKYIPNGNNMYE